MSELAECKLCGHSPITRPEYSVHMVGCADCAMEKIDFTPEQWRTLMGEPKQVAALEPVSDEPVAEVIHNVVGVDIAWIHLPSEGKRPPVGTKLYAHPPAQEWIKCSERLPDVGQPVLVHGIDEYPVVGYITAVGWVCYATDKYMVGEPFRWMPLPPAEG